ncbi:MAG: sialate O-acetylesterase, partial [Cyanobacteria bacterium P01_A01_bin.116]
VEYYFGGGQDAYLFDLDTNTGVLSFQEAADYENPADANRDNIYDVNILAIDYTGQSVNKTFGIKVQDVTAGDPTPPANLAIATNGGGTSATIDVTEGTSLVTDINVTGAGGGFTEGNGVEYYFFGGQDAYLFDLDNDTGVLSFQNAPDFDNPVDANGDNRYDVKILAIDYAGQQTTQTMAIEVQEAVPQAPVITSNGGNDTAIINIDEGDIAVTDVNASAANGASEGNGFTYSLNDGADANLFNINPTTGVISFKSAPDFENPGDADSNNVYFANVLVQDPTGVSDSQFLSVVVKNVVEANNKPVITSNGGEDSAFVQVRENTALAVDMAVTDAEGDTEGNGITYQINAGEDANRFNIDVNTGVISFKVTPDFENPLDDDGNNIYRINVLAFDSQGQADSQFIEIEVTNMVSVYLLGGQSNMAGETSNVNDLAGTPLANPLPAVQIWQPGFNDFEALRPGFNSNFGTGSGFGAELGFGHAMEAARANGSLDSEEIYIVKYAIGATSLAVDWNVNGGSTYNSFKSWVGGALDHLEAANIGFEIEAMLWMQGENDAFTPNGSPAGSFAANYQANLTSFISDIRNRYNTNMDFVIGRLHDELTPNFYTDAEVVRSAQTNVANANSKNYLVDTDDFTVNPVDGVHFDSSGHLALGEAFADVLLG